MKQILITLTAILCTVLIVMADTAAPPILINGPACPAGSARSNKWILYEDQNGDGVYDFITLGHCDGNVSGYNWDESYSGSPWELSGGELISVTPAGRTPNHVEMTANLGQNGLYTWVLTEIEDATGNEICRIERTEAMEYLTTCPPETGGGLE